MAKKVKEEAIASGPPLPRDNPYLEGHTWAEQQFLDSWHSGRLHHGWLLTGAEGIGKATLAYRMARFALAGGPASGLFMEPFHPVFRRVSSGGHGDLLVLERTMDDTKGRLKKSIPVDAVRQVSSFLRMTASEGGWRVVLVDGADTLTTEGQNALLKILEEPPRQSLLILTAENAGGVLPTLRSRTRRLQLRTLDPETVSRVCARYATPDSTIGLAAEGSVGRALRLMQTKAVDHLASLVRTGMESTPNRDSRLQQWADTVAQQKDEHTFDTVSSVLVWWLNRLIHSSARTTLPDEIFPGEHQTLKTFSAAKALPAWIDAHDKVKDLFRQAETAHLDPRLILLQAAGFCLPTP